VSPPATENASGKFDAPNTATGPSCDVDPAQVGPAAAARARLRRIDRARRASRPWRTTCANSRSWPDRAPALGLRGLRAGDPVLGHRADDELVADREGSPRASFEEGGRGVRGRSRVGREGGSRRAPAASATASTPAVGKARLERFAMSPGMTAQKARLRPGVGRCPIRMARRSHFVLSKITQT
jgi:hypothetical protein